MNELKHRKIKNLPKVTQLVMIEWRFETENLGPESVFNIPTKIPLKGKKGIGISFGYLFTLPKMPCALTTGGYVIEIWFKIHLSHALHFKCSVATYS